MNTRHLQHRMYAAKDCKCVRVCHIFDRVWDTVNFQMHLFMTLKLNAGGHNNRNNNSVYGENSESFDKIDISMILLGNSEKIMSQMQSKENQNDASITQKKSSTEESTSQYQIRPSIGKSFPISAIREIINEVLLQVLDGT